MKITGDALTRLDFLVTKSDVSDFVAKLNTLEQALFNVHQSIEKKAGEIFSHDELSAFKDVMQEQKISFDNRDQVRQFIQELTSSLHTARSLNLIVALEPTEKTLRDLSAWIARNNSAKVFLNLTIDPSIIGGAVIEYNGSYRDFSLKKRLSEEESKKEK